MIKKNSFIFLFSLITISNCKQFTTQPDDSQSLLPSALLFWRNSNLISISGQAVKGVIRNGIVQVTPINNQGVCDKGNILATENTNALGVYNLRYTKTGKSVCVIVSGNSSGTSTMYDEKTLSEISVPSNFEITNIISESTIKNQDKKNTIVSLFSRMVSSRLQSLQKANPNQDLNTSLRKAGKEITIRFGLNTGIGGALGRTNLTELKNLNDGAFPEYNDIAFDLNNPSSPLASKFIAISGGFSHLANRFKTGNRTRTEDIETVINAFASDFEDGAFDGQTVNGDSITLGTGTNRITFPSDPLTRILYPAIQAYFAEGGTLSVGAPLPSGTRPPTLTTAQLGTVQFVDSATIVVQPLPGSPAPQAPPSVPPTLSYTGSPYTFATGYAITPITPVTSGVISNCTSSPSLPSGLVINPTTCVISGNPSVFSGATNYTITASNSVGNATATINITLSLTQPATTATRVYGQNNNFGTTASGITATSFYTPTAVAVDSSGVYVAESTNHRVLFFATGSTTATRVYGQGGSFVTATQNNGGVSANSLNGPEGVAVDSTGVYISDTLNSRVLFYPGTSTTATRVYGQGGSFGTPTSNNGGVSANSLNVPRGIFADGTGLYVADDINYRVLYYAGTSTTASRVYGQFNNFTCNLANNNGVCVAGTTSANNLSNVTGVFADTSGVYIVDIGSQRALFFPGTSTTATRAYGQSNNFTTVATGTTASQVYGPRNIVADANGVYLSETVNRRVLFFPGTSTTASIVYGQPTGNFACNVSYHNGTCAVGSAAANNMTTPNGLTIDATGLYVSDNLANRVLFFPRP